MADGPGASMSAAPSELFVASLHSLPVTANGDKVIDFHDILLQGATNMNK